MAIRYLGFQHEIDERWKKMVSIVDYAPFLAIFILLIFIIILFTSKQPEGRRTSRKNQPPSPPALPLIGHLHLLKQPLNHTFQSLSDKYGDVLLLQLGVRKTLVVSSPSAAEDCFTKNDIIFANRPKSMAAEHFSYNFTTMSVATYGDYWRNLRRFGALELFSASRIASFASTRKTELNLVMAEMMRESSLNNGSAKVDLHSIFPELTFNILSMALAGKRFYGENSPDDEGARKTKVLIKRMFMRSGAGSNFGDYLPFLRWFDYKGVEKRFSNAMNEIDRFITDLVEECRARADQAAENGTMIDRLLQLQKDEPEYYTDQLIKGIVLILIVAVADTVSITMEWAMALLLNNPESMKKIKAEIDEHVPENMLLEDKDLPNFTYLQNVVKETLRFYPPIPFLIPHEASKDCVVKGYDISKGTTLLVNVWAIERDPSVWENPMEFIPERHEGRRRDEYSLMAFGAGRRGCPGEAFGTRILELVLGTFVQTFEWERISEEMVDMSEGIGFSLPKLEPLEAICRPRQSTIQHSLIAFS